MIYTDTAMQKLSKINEAANAICLNATTRTQFEVAARNVFRKYKALYPEVQVKPFTPQYNAIEAIYRQLNQKTKTADITEVMMQLQQEVNMSISLDENIVRESDYVDLANLDFDKLRAAFSKSQHKNAVVFSLQAAIERKLKQMLNQNSIRLQFYEKYKEIIEAYNAGKDLKAVQEAFDNLNAFMENDLNPELERAILEGLDEETLAIYDLLKKPTLTKAEQKAVKKVAKTTLEVLKAEKLKLEHWRRSTQVSAQVQVSIDQSLQYLPADPYPDNELAFLSQKVYQHIHSHYQGGIHCL
jgi:type I restriction enzyme R subunit